MRAIPYTKAAYELLHRGSLALAQVENNGMMVDVPYLEWAIKDTEQQIADKEREFRESRIAKVWKKHYREKFNLNSNDQLAKVLFEIEGFKNTRKTASGGYSTDEEALSTVKDPSVQTYVMIKRLKKGLKTYLHGIRRELVGSILRPSFNLQLAVTYRSSCDHPNFQNIPVRIPWLKKLIRKCIRARPGRRLVEVDYKGIEVVGTCCYHKDPTMITYLSDKTKDMHRDMAMECFKLPQDQVSSLVRYVAKNKFVFPEFYGSWYLDCARNMWNSIESLKLETEGGVPLREHLRQQGIRKLGRCDENKEPEPGTFEHHIRAVERRLWNKRFPVYAQWKKDWYNTYKRRGWMKTLTGFILQGYMKRNEAINYPAQGSAFHMLLWSLCELQLSALARHKMEALIVGQIHDSGLADVPEAEVDDFITLCEYTMTVRLRREWEWIIVPLEIQAEVSPVGGSWLDKEARK